MPKLKVPADAEFIHDYPHGMYLSRHYIMKKCKICMHAFWVMVKKGIFLDTKKRDNYKRPLYPAAQADAMIYAYRLYKKGKLPRSLIRAYIDQQLGEKDNTEK